MRPAITFLNIQLSNSRLKSAMTKVTIDGLTGDEMSWSESGEVNKDPKAVVIENGEYVGM